ncbi:uncharacterized protein LOC124279049 [Haliotis rubra]|uniref:uncharacterized protein LOC124279049 n=1 Tax=Haliotis rubra TaxID=36100 RepID=UPI001EE55D69|nr:uncharacterized protein LOC124279049 [Haliotis rubra]
MQKGLNYYQQGYIHEVTLQFPTVSAKCWPSLRKNNSPHRLSLDLDVDRIKYAYCSCKAGLSGKCSHIIGLIKTLQGFKLHNFKEIPSDLSSTSMPQQWNKPRGDKILPVPISQVVVARPTEQRKRKPIQCHTNMNYKLPRVDMASLQTLQGTPLLHRTAQHDLPSVQTPLGDVPIGSALSYQVYIYISMSKRCN